MFGGYHSIKFDELSIAVFTIYEKVIVRAYAAGLNGSGKSPAVFWDGEDKACSSKTRACRVMKR